MKKFLLLSGLIIYLTMPFKSWGSGKIHLEFLPGIAGTLPMPLNVYQDDEKVFSKTAHYETRSLTLPIYYSYRIGYFNNKIGWELEMNHLKIYLKNTNEVVSHFSVSHGYNQLWFNIVKEQPFGMLRFGLGPVISHDETTVNGRRLSETGGLFNNGYYIHGLSCQAAYQKKWWVWDYIYLSAEAKVSFGYARISVVDGYANTPLIAGHLLLGAGVAF